MSERPLFLPGGTPSRKELRRMKDSPAGSPRSWTGSPTAALAKRPKLLLCQYCGREYGTKSLPIHQKRCRERYGDEDPEGPQETDDALRQVVEGKMTVAEYNELAWDQWLQKGRQECPNCSRKFLPERLEVHLRSCKKGGFFARQIKRIRARRASKASSVCSGDELLEEAEAEAEAAKQQLQAHATALAAPGLSDAAAGQLSPAKHTSPKKVSIAVDALASTAACATAAGTSRGSIEVAPAPPVASATLVDSGDKLRDGEAEVLLAKRLSMPAALEQWDLDDLSGDATPAGGASVSDLTAVASAADAEMGAGGAADRQAGGLEAAFDRAAEANEEVDEDGNALEAVESAGSPMAGQEADWLTGGQDDDEAFGADIGELPASFTAAAAGCAPATQGPTSSVAAADAAQGSADAAQGSIATGLGAEPRPDVAKAGTAAAAAAAVASAAAAAEVSTASGNADAAESAKVPPSAAAADTPAAVNDDVTAVDVSEAAAAVEEELKAEADAAVKAAREQVLLQETEETPSQEAMNREMQSLDVPAQETQSREVQFASQDQQDQPCEQHSAAAVAPADVVATAAAGGAQVSSESLAQVTPAPQAPAQAAGAMAAAAAAAGGSEDTVLATQQEQVQGPADLPAADAVGIPTADATAAAEPAAPEPVADAVVAGVLQQPHGQEGEQKQAGAADSMEQPAAALEEAAHLAGGVNDTADVADKLVPQQPDEGEQQLPPQKIALEQQHEEGVVEQGTERSLASDASPAAAVDAAESGAVLCERQLPSREDAVAAAATAAVVPDQQSEVQQLEPGVVASPFRGQQEQQQQEQDEAAEECEKSASSATRVPTHAAEADAVPVAAVTSSVGEQHQQPEPGLRGSPTAAPAAATSPTATPAAATSPIAATADTLQRDSLASDRSATTAAAAVAAAPIVPRLPLHQVNSSGALTSAASAGTASPSATASPRLGPRFPSLLEIATRSGSQPSSPAGALLSRGGSRLSLDPTMLRSLLEGGAASVVSSGPGSISASGPSSPMVGGAVASPSAAAASRWAASRASALAMTGPGSAGGSAGGSAPATPRSGVALVAGGLQKYGFTPPPSALSLEGHPGGPEGHPGLRPGQVKAGNGAKGAPPPELLAEAAAARALPGYLRPTKQSAQRQVPAEVAAKAKAKARPSPTHFIDALVLHQPDGTDVVVDVDVPQDANAKALPGVQQLLQASAAQCAEGSQGHTAHTSPAGIPPNPLLAAGGDATSGAAAAAGAAQAPAVLSPPKPQYNPNLPRYMQPTTAYHIKVSTPTHARTTSAADADVDGADGDDAGVVKTHAYAGGQPALQEAPSPATHAAHHATPAPAPVTKRPVNTAGLTCYAAAAVMMSDDEGDEPHGSLSIWDQALGKIAEVAAQNKGGFANPPPRNAGRTPKAPVPPTHQPVVPPPSRIARPPPPATAAGSGGVSGAAGASGSAGSAAAVSGAANSSNSSSGSSRAGVNFITPVRARSSSVPRGATLSGTATGARHATGTKLPQLPGFKPAAVGAREEGQRHQPPSQSQTPRRSQTPQRSQTPRRSASPQRSQTPRRSETSQRSQSPSRVDTPRRRVAFAGEPAAAGGALNPTQLPRPGQVVERRRYHSYDAADIRAPAPSRMGPEPYPRHEEHEQEEPSTAVAAAARRAEAEGREWTEDEAYEVAAALHKALPGGKALPAIKTSLIPGRPLSSSSKQAAAAKPVRATVRFLDPRDDSERPSVGHRRTPTGGPLPARDAAAIAAAAAAAAAEEGGEHKDPLAPKPYMPKGKAASVAENPLAPKPYVPKDKAASVAEDPLAPKPYVPKDKAASTAEDPLAPKPYVPKDKAHADLLAPKPYVRREEKKPAVTARATARKAVEAASGPSRLLRPTAASAAKKSSGHISPKRPLRPGTSGIPREKILGPAVDRLLVVESPRAGASPRGPWTPRSGGRRQPSLPPLPHDVQSLLADVLFLPAGPEACQVVQRHMQQVEVNSLEDVIAMGPDPVEGALRSGGHDPRLAPKLIEAAKAREAKRKAAVAAHLAAAKAQAR